MGVKRLKYNLVKKTHKKFPSKIRIIGIDILLYIYKYIYSSSEEPLYNLFDIDQFDEDTFYANEILPNGNIVAYSMIPSPSGYGYEIDLDGNVIFKTETYGHHHEFIKSSKNTFAFSCIKAHVSIKILWLFNIFLSSDRKDVFSIFLNIITI